MKVVKVREAVLDDYKAIAQISRNDLGYSFEEELVKSRIVSLDKKRECVFVAEYEKIVIGYVHIEKYETLYSEPLVNVLGLAVDIRNRRKGVGKLLMSSVEDWAKLVGVVGIRLNSGGSRLDAHAFYRAMGYNLEKEQIRFLKIL